MQPGVRARRRGEQALKLPTDDIEPLPVGAHDVLLDELERSRIDPVGTVDVNGLGNAVSNHSGTKRSYCFTGEVTMIGVSLVG